jgi:hypothetical protein
MTTAVEGGHITSLDESNKVIREIVEARNVARSPKQESHGYDSETLRAAKRHMDSLAEFQAQNPKDIVGASKLPLHLWPTTASALGCIALHNGAAKYGRSNWREVGVRASIYFDACQRHLAAWFEGEQCDEEGVPHLGAALACLAILVDCEAAGKLVDDRQYPGGHRELIQRLTPLVDRLHEQHAGKSPKHYTIGDAT